MNKDKLTESGVLLIQWSIAKSSRAPADAWTNQTVLKLPVSMTLLYVQDKSKTQGLGEFDLRWSLNCFLNMNLDNYLIWDA